MSKELEIITEYIEKIEEYEKKTGKQYPSIYMSKEVCIAIKEKLQRLEAIENANTSEALAAYEKLDNTLCLNSSGATKVKPDGTIVQGNIEFNTDKDEHIDCKDIDEMVDCLETIKQALIRLEGFDKEYEEFKGLPFETILNLYKDKLVIDTIIGEYEKLKSTKSKKEQAWDIAIKKNISIYLIKFFVADGWNYENACRDYECIRQLTEEEFDLLKSEVLKCQKN